MLDIGCGWGGLALHLARLADLRVVGCTLSDHQYAISRERVQGQGLAGRVRIDLLDYRKEEGPFDRIVSVGMFEHVGARHYGEYFRKVRDLLADDGVAVIHSIGRVGPPTVMDAWFRKYIFPGAYIPALSEVLGSVQRTGLWITDVEVLRLHYADTLRRWREHFVARWNDMARLYDGRFCRMWEYYLTAAECQFRFGEMMVFQLQLAKRIDTVPRARDYMYVTEADLAGAQPKVRRIEGPRPQAS